MEPVHVAITRIVKPGMEADFERGLRNFVRESLELSGTTGVHLVSPVSSINGHEFGILRSFESEAAREAFYASELFAQWQAQSAPMVVGDTIERRLHGLEASFRGSGKAPPRWKMAIVTWIGVFPAVLLWSYLLTRPLSALHPLVAGAIVDMCVVVTLAWGFMPLLTKALAAWLRAAN